MTGAAVLVAALVQFQISILVNRTSHMKIRILFALAMLAFSAIAAAANPQVELKTSMGSITLELYPDKAPKTVENFLQYVKEGHYKGTIFHRVIPGFMIQAGGFSNAFVEKKTREP